MRGAVLPHVTSQHYVFSYKINERSSSKVKGQGQRSRSVKIYIITKIPYYRGLYYFSKSSIFEKYIGHRGLSACYFSKSSIFEKYIGHRGLSVCLFVCLFVTLRKTFRKVYWSPRSVCVSVCLFVSLFVCLSSKALQAAPLVRSSCFLLQKMSSGHATMQNFFFWQSDEGQGQGHHFCENQIMDITFEPEVTETSGWLQNVPYIIPLLTGTLRFDVRRHVFRSRDFKKFSENHIMGHNFWTGSGRDFWLAEN